MTIYDRPAPAWRASSPLACLAFVLSLSLGLFLLPERVATVLRRPAHAALRPGLIGASRVRRIAEDALIFVSHLGSGAECAAKLEQELEELREHVGQLEAEAVWLRSLAANQAEDQVLSAPLLKPRLIEARVLGRQSQSVLAREGLLDVGSQQGVSSGDLVLDVPAMIDYGASAGAASGQLVLAGRRVWGKLTQVQPHLSLVRRANDAGYRDLVRIAQPDGERLTPGPRGVLEGTGEGLCRLRLVPVTEAVSVGQWVVTEGGEGLIDGRFLYGRIERVEQLPGAAHWEIWVRPALSSDVPNRVAVLTGETTTLSFTR
jgi:cell shape-determining protein MreC